MMLMPFFFVLLLALLLVIRPSSSFLIAFSSPRESLRQSLDPKVLYESDRLLAIDKPEGIAHHEDGDGGSGVLSLVRKWQSQGRLYGVHRLDRVTSGILLLAKDGETATVVSNRFREGSVLKYYCGISGRKATKKKQGWVKGNMVKGRRKSWMLTRPDTQPTEQHAVTRFFTKSLVPLSDQLLDNTVLPTTLILLHPHTGKTHQLRVAAKSLGLPLLGDPIYKDGSETASISRTYLHSTILHLDLDDGESVTVYSQHPVWGLAVDQPGKCRVCFHVSLTRGEAL